MRGVGGPLLTIGDLLSDLAVEGGDGPLVGVGDASAPSSPAASQQGEKADPFDLSRLFEVRARFPSTHVLSIRHLLASSLLGSSQLPADAGGFLFLCVSVSFELGSHRELGISLAPRSCVERTTGGGRDAEQLGPGAAPALLHLHPPPPPGPPLEAIRHGKSAPFISPSFWIPVWFMFPVSASVQITAGNS